MPLEQWSQIQAQVWKDLLSGALSLYDARPLLLKVGMTQADIDSFLETAKNTRQAGLDIGANWTQPAQGTFNPTTTPPKTGPDLSATSQPVGTQPVDWRLLAEDQPGAAYMRRYGLGAMGQSPFQQYVGSQASPTYGTFQAQNILNPTAPRNWEDYLNKAGGGYSQARAEAPGLFQQALGRTPTAQRTMQEGMGEGDFRGWLSNVLLGRYAAPVARRFASSLPGQQEEFTARTGGEGSFLEYLKKQFGL